MKYRQMYDVSPAFYFFHLNSFQMCLSVTNLQMGLKHNRCVYRIVHGQYYASATVKMSTNAQPSIKDEAVYCKRLVPDGVLPAGNNMQKK